MEWYFEGDVEDLTVPKDEIFNRPPSPHSWSSWGTMVGKINCQEKRNAFGVEELPLSGTMFSSAVEQHSPPSICERSRHNSRQRSARPHHYSDIELDDLPIMDDADDIFFDSLFEVDARALDEAECSANYTQTSSEDDVMATVDLQGERNHSGYSTYDVENVCHFPQEKDLKAEYCAFKQQPNEYADMSEEYISKDESVLLELQRLTVQMAKKTRIGFRDSLYRLAENSRYRTEYRCHGEEDFVNCKPSTRDEPSRLPEPKDPNSDNNAIDRTVATLLFDTMKFCGSSSSFTSGLDFAETFQREYQANAHSYHQDSSATSLHTVQQGDTEVPTFALTNHQTSLMWS